MPAGQQQLHRNPAGMGTGINRSPRLYHGDVNPAPRVQPTVAPKVETTTTPEQRVLRPGAGRDRTGARDWRNRVGAGNDWRKRNNRGNDQAQNDNELRRRHGGDGHHNWHHDWDHNHHHRDWWRNHYDRFVLFGGGYYYWDAGFWYPAYGYDPYFSTYVYDAPIYGSDSLSPAEVMSSVQTELARLGYYNGPIDGTYGPLTREALLQYQQSAGLEVTGLLDQPTLESLGLY